MRKKILVAEEVDTVRSVAETVLRQNGFEVISVASADRAREVLQFARPDVIVMGAEVSTRDSRPLYEKVQADPRTANVPILIIAGENNLPVPFPREAVAARPLEPIELLQKVQALAGELQPESGISIHPLTSGAVSDDFLDAALGLDDIDVTDSEVLDRTNLLKKQGRGPADQMMPIHHENDAEDMSDSSRVESLMIPADGTDIRQPKPKANPKPDHSGGTGKLEIMSDQYGLSNPDALKSQNVHQNHDYDWFVSSMREENDQRNRPKGAPAPPDNSSFSFEDPLDSAIDAALGTGAGENTTRPASGSKSTVGVEKFIDEFRREMDLIRSTESEDTLGRDEHAERTSGQNLQWEESIEKVGHEQVTLFTRQMATELADKLAARIIAKIDADKLLQLIAQEIASRAKKH